MVQIPRLREWREARALTQVELAGKAGVSSRSVAGYEAGTGARPPTVRKLAEALDVEVGDLVGVVTYPKEESRSSLEPKLFNGNDDERRLRYLRGWRAFVHGLARRWKERPPKTSAEISPLFDAMTALVEQGVFEPSDASPAEAAELALLMGGFQRLNDIADTVEKDEEAEQRRATFQLIQEKRGA